MASSAQTPDPVLEISREHGRSVVATRYGIVATSQTLASAAGVKVLERGGNAIDAAIAANALMGLVEPTGNGMGGDLFAIVYEAKTGKVHGLNASGWAPSGLTPEFLESKSETKMPETGIHSVTVPGAVAGWDALHRKFGKLPWSQLFDAAIFYADEGFPVTDLIAEQWASPKAAALLAKDPNCAKTYLMNGRTPKTGEIFRNPDLGRTLRLVASKGRDAFYAGPISQAILETSKNLGGTFTAADFAEYQAEWVTPISVNYRGWTVTELPPNGQGIAALMMLKLMERFPLDDYGYNSAKALHVMIEAKKLAYADMLKNVGDPRFTDIPVTQLLSDGLASERAKLIDLEKAKCEAVPTNLLSLSKLPGADTIYMSVIDKDGNIVSLIQSNYKGFGSGVVPAGMGFMLQNRGELFTLERNHPNTLAPRKRPIHTIIPGFMSKGDVRIGFGIMGGWNQAQAHAQFVANVVDYGFDVQRALEAPRFTKLTFSGCDVSVESRVPESVRAELKSLGHEIAVLGPYSQAAGGGQAVMAGPEGVHFGGSDPRKDGSAIPESPAAVIGSARARKR